MLQTVRNVAIILALALVVDLAPGGGDAAETVLTALLLAFLAAIAWFGFRFYRDQQLTLMTLSDGRRAILFGALGVMALLIAGYEELSDWSGGILLWIALMAGAVGAIFLVWRDATRYG
ncbi:MAG: hypothetical protein ACRDL6_01070 [Solirubrobacterales bacterium]